MPSTPMGQARAPMEKPMGKLLRSRKGFSVQINIELRNRPIANHQPCIGDFALMRLVSGDDLHFPEASFLVRANGSEIVIQQTAKALVCFLRIGSLVQFADFIEFGKSHADFSSPRLAAIGNV